jgi:hypothetical protein
MCSRIDTATTLADILVPLFNRSLGHIDRAHLGIRIGALQHTRIGIQHYIYRHADDSAYLNLTLDTNLTIAIADECTLL